MNLEKAQEIKKLCDKISEIEQTIKDIHDCCYIDLNIMQSLILEDPVIVRVCRGSKVYNHIIQGYKEERNNLIKTLNDM